MNFIKNPRIKCFPIEDISFVKYQCECVGIKNKSSKKSAYIGTFGIAH